MNLIFRALLGCPAAAPAPPPIQEEPPCPDSQAVDADAAERAVAEAWLAAKPQLVHVDFEPPPGLPASVDLNDWRWSFGPDTLMRRVYEVREGGECALRVVAIAEGTVATVSGDINLDDAFVELTIQDGAVSGFRGVATSGLRPPGAFDDWWFATAVRLDREPLRTTPGVQLLFDQASARLVLVPNEGWYTSVTVTEGPVTMLGTAP